MHTYPKRLAAVLLTSVLTLFACSSGDAPPARAHDPADDVHLPRATGNETAEERNAIAAKIESMLLDAPESEYTVKFPGGASHKSCPMHEVPNGAYVDSLTREIFVDGKVVDYLPECKYRHHFAKRATTPEEAARLEAPKATGGLTTQDLPFNSVYGNTDEQIWQSWSGADPKVGLPCGALNNCQKWFNAEWSEWYVPSAPSDPPTNHTTKWTSPSGHYGYPEGTGYDDDVGFFSSIDPYTEEWILQPVLALDARVTGYYGFAMQCSNGGSCPYSPYLYANPGDHMIGQILTYQQNVGYGGGSLCDYATGYNCTWLIELYDQTTGVDRTIFVGPMSTAYPSLSGNRVNHAFRAVTEARFGPTSSCAELPSSAVTFFNVKFYQPTNTSVQNGYDYTDTTQYLTWWDHSHAGYDNNNWLNCGFWATGGSNSPYPHTPTQYSEELHWCNQQNLDGSYGLCR